MTLAALGLVIAAAFLHAGWNLLAKRVGGGAVFVWLLTAASSVIYAPVAIAWIAIAPPTLGLAGWLCVAATAVLHVAYFIVLQRGYRVGDLSVVYPLARGTGPLLAALVAIVLFGERPSALALVGIGLIVTGVFAISGGLKAIARGHLPRGAVGYGLLTGLLIASYTLLDKYAVATLVIAPLIYDWLGMVGRWLILAPYAWPRRAEAATLWRAHRGSILGIAVMSPMAYILVLTALRFTPVSYVAPAREMSILIGVLLGARVLDEGQMAVRLTAAAAIVAGVVALTLG